MWNSHHIRPSHNARAPNGRPLILFTCPESEGTVNYIRAVPTEEVEVCQTESTFKDYECDPDFYELCSILMEERALTEPSNHVEALALYLTLRNMMQRHLRI